MKLALTQHHVLMEEKLLILIHVQVRSMPYVSLALYGQHGGLNVHLNCRTKLKLWSLENNRAIFRDIQSQLTVP